MLNQKYEEDDKTAVSILFVKFYCFFFQIVVLLVGTNNISNTAEEIAEGIFEIVQNIRDKLPDVYIVLPVCSVLVRIVRISFLN